MNDLLGWISRNNEAAFFLGVFTLICIMITANFLIRLARSITGHYPAATVVSRCNSSDPCYCCRENECDSNCRCYDEDEDGA